MLQWLIKGIALLGVYIAISGVHMATHTKPAHRIPIQIINVKYNNVLAEIP